MIDSRWRCRLRGTNCCLAELEYLASTLARAILDERHELSADGLESHPTSLL